MEEGSDQSKCLFCLDDFFEIRKVSSPRLSPDGCQVLSVVTITDASNNCRKDYIALTSIGDRQLRILTEGNSPLWSPDGFEIAYESDKGGVKTTLIQYIGEGHGWRPDLRPKNKYDLYNRMINWFDQHLNAIENQ